MISHLRVLIADSDSNMLSVMHSLLFNVGIRYINNVRTSTRAESELRRENYDALFLSDNLTPFGGVELTRVLRLTDDSPNQRTPVILVSDRADRNFIEKARDAGISEFIRKPVTGKIMQQRLISVIENPRAFVDAPLYTGPDRRRRVIVDLPKGLDRRDSVKKKNG